MVTNQQDKVAVDTADARAFVRRLTAALRLKSQGFNVCFVDDREIHRLNAEFRGKPMPTDVLSFPWKDGAPCRSGAEDPGVASGRRAAKPLAHSSFFEGLGDEFVGFLGDIVISAETAWRQAAAEGHSTRNEIRWLILHGVLHLLGYDHERDHGEMTALEVALRERLGIDEVGRAQKAEIKSEGKWQKDGPPSPGGEGRAFRGAAACALSPRAPRERVTRGGR